MKRVQDEAVPSALVPLPFITGHDPFEQMTVTAAAAEHFRRCQGQRGASMTMLSLSLFWIYRNARAGSESITVL